MDELHHECGIAAIYHLRSPSSSALTPLSGPEQVSRLMPRMLLDLQNRGQLAAGMSQLTIPTANRSSTPIKQIGTVIEAFRLNHQAKYDSIMNEYAGRAAIGHVRYATCGANDRSYAQPFERHHGCKWKWFSFAFNGQLANFSELRAELLSLADYHLTRETDTEVIMHYLAHELRGDSRPDLVQVFRKLSQKFDGAYNIVFLNAMGDMVVLRDPKGFRPLCYRPGRPAVRRRQRERAAHQPRLPRHPLAGAGRDDRHSGQQAPPAAVRGRETAAGALLLRVDLLRQRRQHPGRPQRLPDAGRARQGTGPTGTQC